jgi:hypothetical protein
MSAELVAQLPPRVWDRQTAAGYNTWANAVTGKINTDLFGLRLNKLNTVPAANTPYDGYVTTFQIPGNLTMGTGLTFYFDVVDNAEFQSDPGLVIQLGVTVLLLGAGVAPLFSGGGTEQTVNITMNATSGDMAQGTLAIASANLNGAVVGSVVAVRLRRIGTATADTMQGSAILLACAVKNT